jgi:hypothetical protein
MKGFLIVILTTLATLSSVCANLGDSDAKIEDSYGTIVERHLRDDGTVSVLYHKDRYLHLVIFDKQVSVSEALSRVDHHELSEKEITKYLKNNAGRATWRREESSEERRYQRSDRRAEAAYLSLNGRPTLRVRVVREGKVIGDK